MFPWQTLSYRPEPLEQELDALLRAALLRLCAADAPRAADERWAELRAKVQASTRERSRPWPWRGRNT